jgi:hypothetical protein
VTGHVPEIWVGDLVQAWEAVGHSPDTRRRIARLLGFDEPLTASRSAALPPPATRPGTVATQAGPPAATPHIRDKPPETQLHPPNPAVIFDDLPVLIPEQLDTPAVTDWEAVPSLGQVTDLHLTSRPPLDPLLTQRSSTAILNAALTTLVQDDGEPDVDTLVDSFARCLPQIRLPRATRHTLRFGVQVLVDMGDGMQPYRRDQYELVQQITGLVGPELTQVRYFADVPTRGTGPGPRRTWQTYRTPGPGTRVLIVSDLGVGGPFLDPRRASVAEWQQVLDEISRAGCTAVALVPYPADKVPAGLARLLSALTWDRTTTVSTVAALVGRRP